MLAARFLVLFWACTLWLVSFAALSEADLHFSVGGPHNFGIVVHNEDYTIYRSAALGKSGLADVAAFLKKQSLPFPTTIIYMHVDGFEYSFAHPTLFAVEEYEERTTYGFEFYHAFRYDYSTYLSGTNPFEASKNLNKKSRMCQLARSYFGFQPDAQIVGGVDAFYRILDLVLEAKGPVLFHCSGGRHRTGMIAMALRYLQGGGWLEGTHRGPSARRQLNRAQFEYNLHNQFMFRVQNLQFIEQWAKDPKFAEYQMRYKEKLNKPSLMTWSR